MTYILTAQLEDEATGGEAFARYQTYLASVRDEMPPGAFALATSDWYFDSGDHRAPHDAWLERVELTERSLVPAEPYHQQRAVSLTVRLLGAYHDGHIELRYHGVSRYELEFHTREGPMVRGHRDWRYDEFRLVTGRRVEHEIEWWGMRRTGNWLIEADDVTYAWLPIVGPGNTATDV